MDFNAVLIGSSPFVCVQYLKADKTLFVRRKMPNSSNNICNQRLPSPMHDSSSHALPLSCTKRILNYNILLAFCIKKILLSFYKE